MELTTLVQDIHRLGHQLERFERKYNMMSQTFYELYCAGQEPEDDAWVLDFAEWAGLYEIWRDRQKAYLETIDLLREKDPNLFSQIQPVAA
jgi:hypothetical protein